MNCSSGDSGAPIVTRVLIADDHPVTLEGLAALLCKPVGISVVAMAQDGDEVLALYRRHLPDVVILDGFMPKMNGQDTLVALRAEFPQARVLMLSVSDAPDHIYAAMRAGARSYLLKDTPLDELRLAVLDVAAGRPYLCPRVTRRLTERLSMPELTTRELEILGYVTQGRSNHEIAALLFIAEGTVKVHVSSVLHKLGVSDRTQAVTTALKRGLVALN